ncbi:MAG: MFS transporter [Verrucomicrobia bacterium]|nr:MAG: MFS transporter [Verrucomicrobiota bacterium]
MSPAHTSPRWGIVVLLLLSVCINYVDRGSLSVAAPVLSDEFLLSPRKLGYLLSAFFWSYTAFQLVVGWLVDRYDVKWVYAGGFLVWSLAMAATGLANSFAALFAARLVLGIGESVFLPSVSRIVVRLFPAEHRGLPNALVDVGTKIGPGLSTLLGGLFIGRYGWRALFIGVGLASLLWLLPWIYSVPGDPVQADRQRKRGPGMSEILSRRETWGTSLGMFALGYVWIFLVTWLPSYLINERNYSVEQMAVFGSLPFWGMAVASLTGGWASDLWIARGGTPTRVRKTFAGTGLILCAALMLPAAFLMNPTLSLGFLIASCVSLGIFTSNVWAITQTLAGPEAAGKWTGIQNFIGNLGAVISPMTAGWIAQQTRSFVLAFVVAAVILVLGATCYLLLVPRVEPVAWRKSE